MQFIVEKGLYKVARITGPSHNLLAIRLSEADENIEVVPLPIKANEKVRITPQDVLCQVKSGLSSINQELGKEYFISEIQFLPSDTYSPTVYEMLTRELIKRIDVGGNFVTV